MESAKNALFLSAGVVLSFLFGDWKGIVLALLVLTVIDYASGVATAFYEKKVSSKIGFKGIARKVIIFALVAAAHWVDVSIGTGGNYVRDATVYFYMANEVLSLTENAGRMGVPLPKQLIQAVAILKSKSELTKNDRA